MAPPTLFLGGGSTPLANQVAGHQNVLSDASGSLVIKPALPREIAFYQSLNGSSKSSQLSKLKPYVPQFYGTLRLEGKLDTQGELNQEGLPVNAVPESVVLENLAHYYTRPSIMDVKLGTVLASSDATEKKKVRMENQAKSSTSYETGIRLTGCQTWHAPTSTYILTPKSYGKSLTIPQLPAGLRRYFPLPSDIIPALVSPPSPPPSSTASSNSDQSQISHLPLPPSYTEPQSTATATAVLLDPPTPISSTTSTTPLPIKEYSSHAIPPNTILRLLKLIDRELEALESVLRNLEARFIGSSILIVYEGDKDRLESALDRYEEKRARIALLAAERSNTTQKLGTEVTGVTGVDEEEDEDEDEDEDEEKDEGDSSTSSSSEEDDGAASDARKARRYPPFTLKMIDFAHTNLVQGEGPDQGVLKGFTTLKGLIRGRMEEVEGVLQA